MKNLLILFVILNLAACGNDNSSNQATKEGASTKALTKPQDPIPQTITVKEVSRIALVEAKQFLDNFKNNGRSVPDSTTALYNQAKALFEKGEYKKAQKLAVDVRHEIEKIMMGNKTK